MPRIGPPDRAGPVGLALTAWDLWRRLPPKQRKQLLKAAREHAPKIVETARKHGPPLPTRPPHPCDARAPPQRPQPPGWPATLEGAGGPHMTPPRHAAVVSSDGKSQIQALDRTRPGLPLKRGKGGTMTHDYKRNGTTTLFAALETLQGKVVGECHERHRHQEFLKFLRRLDAEFPGNVPLHLIMDNYGTHKHAKVNAWLKCHPRFVPHFVPTSSSWMNLVERWFGHLDNKAIRRGIFLSVADLQAAIASFLKAWNEHPKPFVWTATVESIQQKLTRCRQTLEQIKPGCTSPKTRKRTR